ncbi:MAG: hypothetical protein ACRD3E_14935 [Terriglobales bacterium]
MKAPRLIVATWTAGIATVWKCSCDGWAIELPRDPLRPQDQAAKVHSAFGQHLKASHGVFSPGERSESTA